MGCILLTFTWRKDLGYDGNLEVQMRTETEKSVEVINVIDYYCIYEML